MHLLVTSLSLPFGNKQIMSLFQKQVLHNWESCNLTLSMKKNLPYKDTIWISISKWVSNFSLLIFHIRMSKKHKVKRPGVKYLLLAGSRKQSLNIALRSHLVPLSCHQPFMLEITILGKNIYQIVTSFFKKKYSPCYYFTRKSHVFSFKITQTPCKA